MASYDVASNICRAISGGPYQDRDLCRGAAAEERFDAASLPVQHVLVDHRVPRAADHSLYSTVPLRVTLRLLRLFARFRVALSQRVDHIHRATSRAAAAATAAAAAAAAAGALILDGSTIQLYPIARRPLPTRRGLPLPTLESRHPPARGFHSPTAKLSLGTFGNTSLALELNLSTLGTHIIQESNWVVWGTK